MPIPGKSFVKAFEYKISDYCESEFTIAVCNATIGIMGAFYALIGKGAEVITTPLTWPGAFSGLIALGYSFRFCDVEPETLTLDPDKLELLITPHTKAVFTADFLGYPAHLDKIKQICDKYNLWLIHDAASSFGSIYDKHYSGYFADVTVLSFGEKKIFSTGEGGAIITQKKEIYQSLLSVLSHPEKQQIETGNINPFSFNTQLNPFSAEYGLSIFDDRLNQIQKNAASLAEYLRRENIYKSDVARPNFSRIIIPNTYSKGKTHNLPFDHLVSSLMGAEEENLLVAKMAIAGTYKCISPFEI